ncbi:hypothetical protein L1281_001495 [Neisseria sp. HSC-16F19]|nr:YbjN domain-containing protein [Neisseria sp. HSC-16F19]MCP2040905.1 hypothetical protein [Neisseria sp. HSC-16F19]
MMMRIYSALLLGLAAPLAAAQTVGLLDGSQPQSMLSAVQQFGSAELVTDSDGDPRINAQAEETRYTVFFYDCTAGKQCRSVQFSASWKQPQAPSAETLNRWNRDKRFGQAYLDAEQDPTLAWDINLAHGISAANWQDTVATWIDTMGQYSTFLYENSR